MKHNFADDESPVFDFSHANGYNINQIIHLGGNFYEIFRAY